MGYLLLGLLAVVCGFVLGRVGLTFLEDIESHLPLPPVPPSRSTPEELEERFNKFKLFSSFFGACVAVVWSLCAFNLGHTGWAVVGALFGGLFIPVVFGGFAVLVGIVCRLPAYCRGFTGKIDAGYEWLKSLLNRKERKVQTSVISEYRSLVIKHGLHSTEAERFLRDNSDNADLQTMAALLKDQSDKMRQPGNDGSAAPSA